MIAQFIAAFLGTISFSLIFHVQKRYYPLCGMIGGIGWLVYLFTNSSVGAAGSSFVAAFVVTFLSRTFAIYKRCPVTIFLISGIFPLVPGAGVYWTAHYLVTAQNQLCLESGMTTIKIAFAITLGIVFVFELPQNFFRKLLFWKKQPIQ